jgi:hypothetical protein
MRVNLIYGPSSEPKTGYLNIHPFAEQEDETTKMCDVRNLDLHVCDAEVTDLVAVDVVDYIPLPEITDVIDHWVSKLRIGGKMTIGAVDAYSVAKAFAEYQIDLDAFNQLILGAQTSPGDHKSNVLTMASLVNYLELKHNLTIIHKRYDGFAYLVTAERDCS